jgi:hypothetical protein
MAWFADRASCPDAFGYVKIDLGWWSDRPSWRHLVFRIVRTAFKNDQPMTQSFGDRKVEQDSPINGGAFE